MITEYVHHSRKLNITTVKQKVKHNSYVNSGTEKTTISTPELSSVAATHGALIRSLQNKYTAKMALNYRRRWRANQQKSAAPGCRSTRVGGGGHKLSAAVARARLYLKVLTIV